MIKLSQVEAFENAACAYFDCISPKYLKELKEPAKSELTAARHFWQAARESVERAQFQIDHSSYETDIPARAEMHKFGSCQDGRDAELCADCEVRAERDDRNGSCEIETYPHTITHVRLPNCKNWQPASPVLTQPSAERNKSIRQYVYDWMDLPTYVKVARLKELNLFQAGDLQVRGDEIDRIWIKRAKEVGVEKKLLRMPTEAERPVLPVPPRWTSLNKIDGQEFVLRKEAEIYINEARSSSPAVAPTNICDRCFTAFPADYRGMRVVFYDPELKCDIWRHAFDCTKPADNNCNSAAPAVAGRTQGDLASLLKEALSFGSFGNVAWEKQEDWRKRVVTALRESASQVEYDHYPACNASRHVRIGTVGAGCICVLTCKKRMTELEKCESESVRETPSYKWTWKKFYAEEFESNMPTIYHIMKRCFEAGRLASPEAQAVKEKV